MEERKARRGPPRSLWRGSEFAFFQGGTVASRTNLQVSITIWPEKLSLQDDLEKWENSFCLQLFSWHTPFAKRAMFSVRCARVCVSLQIVPCAGVLKVRSPWAHSHAMMTLTSTALFNKLWTNAMVYLLKLTQWNLYRSSAGIVLTSVISARCRCLVTMKV